MPVSTSGKHHVGQRGDDDRHQIDPASRRGPRRSCWAHSPVRVAAVRTCTRWRVASETSPRFRNTRLTVISLTPDASETSRSVSGRRGGLAGSSDIGTSCFRYIRALWTRASSRKGLRCDWQATKRSRNLLCFWGESQLCVVTWPRGSTG